MLDQVLNWWKTTTLEEREKFLIEVNAENITPYLWYIYPCLTKEERDKCQKEYEDFRKKNETN